MKRIVQTAVAFWMLFLVVQVSAQAELGQLVITRVNTTEFPDVAVQFQALDTEGQAVQELPFSAVSVQEDGAPVQSESPQPVEEGIAVHFVVDMGVSLNTGRWNQIRGAILDFVQNRMNENSDLVAVTAVKGDVPLPVVDFTGDKTTLVSGIQEEEGWPALETSDTNYSDPLNALGVVLDQMTQLTGGQQKARFIFFFTSAIEQNRILAPSVASTALTLHIPIYTALVRTSELSADGIDFAQPLRELAEGSAGVYTLYGSGSLTILNAPYGRLTEYRRQYQISYRATGTLSGTRQVQLVAANNTAVTGSTTYNILLEAPQAQILEPEANDLIIRRTDTFTSDANTVEPTSKTVVVEVHFPDGIGRSIILAELLVNNEVVGAVRNLAPGKNIEMPWDLRPHQTPGTTEFVVQVDVQDEFGFTVSSDPVLVNVELSIPPNATLEPQVITEIVTRVSEIAITTTPVPCTLPDAFCSVEQSARNNPVSVASLAVAVLALGLVWRNRRRVPQMADAIRETVIHATGRVVRMTKKFTGNSSSAKAYLEVISGDANLVGRSLAIFGDTALGRSLEEGCTYVFHKSEGESPISRLHCTIIDEENHFRIRDENSANGTFLNGARLRARTEEELNDGDEIEVARVERGGVRLLFRLAQGERPSGTERDTAPTRIPPNQEQPNHLEDRF